MPYTVQSAVEQQGDRHGSHVCTGSDNPPFRQEERCVKYRKTVTGRRTPAQPSFARAFQHVFMHVTVTRTSMTYDPPAGACKNGSSPTRLNFDIEKHPEEVLASAIPNKPRTAERGRNT